MREYLEKRVRGDFRRDSFSFEGFYAFNIHSFENEPILDLVRGLYGGWEERQGSIILRQPEFKVLVGEEADKMFWHPELFEGESGLDLSYVLALRKLGVEIPEAMMNKYLGDMEKHGGHLKKLLAQEHQQLERVRGQIADLSFLLAR